MNDAAGTNYNTDYDHLMIKTGKTNNVWLQLYIMIEIIIIFQPVTEQKRLNYRESSVGKLSDTSTRFQH